MRAPAEPLHLAIDDVAAGKTMTFNRAAAILGFWPGLIVLWYAVAAVFILDALQMMTLTYERSPFFAHRFLLAWIFAVFGALYLIQARWMYGGPKALIIPTDITVSDDGILYAPRGTTDTVAVPWKRIPSVRKVEDGFIVVVGSRFARRMVFVPKPTDESLARTFWAMCYGHMVSTRRLHRSLPERLGVIQNTAAA